MTCRNREGASCGPFENDIQNQNPKLMTVRIGLFGHTGARLPGTGSPPQFETPDDPLESRCF
ncbi:MAG: hypothetical protein V4819_26350 [Verrucomicrobiota bacterium]